MPIYEYRCQSCNAVFDTLVRNGQEPTACTACGAEALTRLISRAGVIFKGSGFYVNDSKSSSSSTKGASSENKASESSSTGGTEAGTSSSTTSSDTKVSENKTTKTD